MQSYTKAQALRVIHRSALDYKQNLAHKDLLFVTTTQRASPASFEARFHPSNFLHLTGIKTDLKSLDFYNMAVEDRLNEENIDLAQNGTTDLKLDVLQTLMRIHKTAKLAGDFKEAGSLLITDKLAGTVTAVMGFTKTSESGIYVPNTALKADLRDITIKPSQKIEAVFQKSKDSDKYDTLTYIAKGTTIDDKNLAAVIAKRVDMQNLTALFPIPRKPASEAKA